MPSTQTSTDQIQSVLNAYESSLNTSDAKAAAALYTEDGTFYPHNLPTATGSGIEDAYRSIFEAIRLEIAFTVHEIVVDGDLAFATTGSSGRVTVLAEDLTVPEENRELFVFARVDGQWRIHRYMFNKSSQG